MIRHDNYCLCYFFCFHDDLMFLMIFFSGGGFTQQTDKETMIDSR